MNVSEMLLVSDMDGTLLTTDKRISDQNQAALKRFQAAGGRFTIATGRSIVSASRYVNALREKGIKLDAPAILFNGAAIYDFRQDQMLWHTRMPEELPAYLARVKAQFPEVGIEVLYEEKTKVVTHNRFVRDHLEIESLPYQMADIKDLVPGAIKTLFALEHEKIPCFARFLEEQHFTGVSYVESAEFYYEMLPFGNSKGEALSHLAQYAKVSLDQIAAVGDYNNDIEMIRTAGLGAAMGNALDAVKNAADRTVSTNDQDGLAELIEYMMNRCP